MKGGPPGSLQTQCARLAWATKGHLLTACMPSHPPYLFPAYHLSTAQGLCLLALELNSKILTHKDLEPPLTKNNRTRVRITAKRK